MSIEKDAIYVTRSGNRTTPVKLLPTGCFSFSLENDKSKKEIVVYPNGYVHKEDKLNSVGLITPMEEVKSRGFSVSDVIIFDNDIFIIRNDNDLLRKDADDDLIDLKKENVYV